MLRAALVVAAVVGCVGCGNKDVAQTPVETYTMVDFLCDDIETQTAIVADNGAGDAKESVEETKAPAQSATQAPSSGSTSWMNKTLDEMTEDDMKALAQASDDVVAQYKSRFSEEEKEGIDFAIALVRISIELEEQEKYAMKYEISEAGIANLVTFEKATLQDSQKAKYPNGRAWKNKAGNIVIIDDTTKGVTFTVSAKVGTDEDGNPAYLITVKYSDGKERSLDFGGSGACVFNHGDYNNGYMTNPYMKDLSEIVK